MSTKSLFLILIVLLNSSCVTTHYNSIATSRDNRLDISCDEDSTFRSGYFQMYVCTIENTSNDWIEFEVDRIEFPGNKERIRVSSPKEIEDYNAAFKFQKRQNNYQERAILAGLIVTGLAAMATGNSSASKLGAATVVGATTYSAAREERQIYQKVQYSYGSQHIKGKGIKIPPELFVRKHFLVQRKIRRQKRDAYRMLETVKICIKRPLKECFIF